MWKTFVACRLHALASPYESTEHPRYVVAKLCAASYRTGMPRARPMASSASMSHGVPNTCVATMPDVRLVMAASTAAGSTVNVSRSMSANTGVQPSQTSALVVAT